jgi:TPR repeat protein
VDRPGKTKSPRASDRGFEAVGRVEFPQLLLAEVRKENLAASRRAETGALYEKGLGVSKDQARAAALYQKACEGGFSEACTVA